MPDLEVFQNRDLVLRVSASCDPDKFRPDKYESFLDALCGDREYQKEGVREVTRYFLGGEYEQLRDLGEENYHLNPRLQGKYGSWAEFARHLQLPDKLSCSLDHATATGKSYVMYGVARIMLAEGAVDQVLILCPSNTIEFELTNKFRSLAADRALKDLLPPDSKVLNPRIVNASVTIQPGDICIENIHATYARTKSAIEDSLLGRGARTLVENDEAHHLMSPWDAALKKWKEFLLDERYAFRYIVNASGTCYIGDDYFTDVVHRFSVRDAMEARFVKLVRYVAEDSSGSEDEKLQKIYDNHLENKTVRYRRVKPITILVTKNISACKRLTEKLIDFLSRKEDTPKELAAKKVLIVTSALEHQRNIPLLRQIDEEHNPIEWVTSVSMLSEGWDVKNVFQIVPHEERAFNSKLLIAQVLGRGLRIPEKYRGTQPLVTVFNHARWSTSIKNLVDEVLEIEKRMHSYPVEKSEDYNFDLLNIEYRRVEEEVEYPQEDAYELLKKGYVTYSSQSETVEKATVYKTAISGQQDIKKTLIQLRTYPIEAAALEVVNKLRAIDMDLGTHYSEEFSRDRVAEVIRKSLEEVGDNSGVVSEANLQKTLQAFGVVYRRSAKSLRLKIEADNVERLSTRDLGKSGVAVGSLRRGCTVFYDNYATEVSGPEDIRILRELIDDESLPRSAIFRVDNKYDFKTPSNVVFAISEPERKFVRGLTAGSTASSIDGWIKSVDVGFYGIEYSWRKGEHPKQGTFNPDFFIKKGKDILVVEIKMDDDVSDENKAKLRYATEHFSRLNQLQNDSHYHLKFISPKSYDLFFKTLRDGTHTGFRSELEAKLLS